MAWDQSFEEGPTHLLGGHAASLDWAEPAFNLWGSHDTSWTRAQMPLPKNFSRDAAKRPHWGGAAQPRLIAPLARATCAHASSGGLGC